MNEPSTTTTTTQQPPNVPQNNQPKQTNSDQLAQCLQAKSQIEYSIITAEEELGKLKTQVCYFYFVHPLSIFSNLKAQSRRRKNPFRQT